MGPSDEQLPDLVELLATNLDRYFPQLVLSTQQRLYAFALRQAGSPQDAEDIMNEQVQAYAAGQYTPHNATPYGVPSDEYAEIMPSRHEKVTSYRMRRKSHKGWWAIIVVVALLFLGVGRLSTMFAPQINFGIDQKDVKSVVVSKNVDGFPMRSTYEIIMQTALSSTLHLTSQQLLAKLKERGSPNIIAIDQGVSTSYLGKAELNAFNTILHDAASTGQISPAYADQWMNQLQNNSDLRDKIAVTLVMAAPTP
ncbi:MAG TPA: hypothetical protein VII61_02285 [Ktedonobacteraceae bacterium]